MSKQQIRASKSELIPRPPGENGKAGWNLKDQMGLKDNKDLYMEIMVRDSML